MSIESVDISADCEATKKAFERLVEKSGPVDVLINNAGVFKCLEFNDTTAKDFDVRYSQSAHCIP